MAGAGAGANEVAEGADRIDSLITNALNRIIDALDLIDNLACSSRRSCSHRQSRTNAVDRMY